MQNDQIFDYVIVGAGPAGCVLANRLSADPDVRVLLLEAGGSDWHPYIHMPAGFAKLTGTLASWGWSTVPQKHIAQRVFWYPQGKVMGGGSSINAQIYTRGNSADYDRWAEEGGCVGWSYKDLLPYFKKSEDNDTFVNEYHSAGGPIGVSHPGLPLPLSRAFIRAAQEAGIPYNPDFNGASQAGVGFYQMTQRGGRRSSAVGGYILPIRGRANLEIRTRAFALRILIEKNAATGVVYAQKNRAERVVRAEREVIITSGAIGSPKLLKLSGIGPADELRGLGIKIEADLPGVGANLQDHMDVYAVCELKGRHSYDSYKKWYLQAAAGLQYITSRTGPVASNLIDAGGFWFADKTAPQPDLQLHFTLGSGLEEGMTKLNNDGITLESALLRPRSRGWVKLASADPAASPLIDPNYWSDPYDREMSINGFLVVREILNQKSLAPFILAERSPGPEVKTRAEILDYAYTVAKTDYHPVGTCKMGVDSTAVVRPDLKVRGIDRLRVCDSSIMPFLPSCNTNAPTMAISERAASLILGQDDCFGVAERPNMGAVLAG